MGPQPTILHPGPRPAEPAGTGDARRAARARGKPYSIILRIRHPTLDPATVTGEFGRQPDLAWKTGDPCRTPTGGPLPGTRSDGLWSQTFRDDGAKTIGSSLGKLADELSAHRKFFEELRERGVRAALYLQLPGDVNNGDRIPSETLGKLAVLNIDLEIEVFPEWR